MKKDGLNTVIQLYPVVCIHSLEFIEIHLINAQLIIHIVNFQLLKLARKLHIPLNVIIS